MRPGAGRRGISGAAGWLAAALLILAVPGASQERFRRMPPVADPRQELKLPAIETATLPNGLTVGAATRPGSRLVTVQLVILAGESHSPARTPGVAALTARMIGRGTKILSAEDIENSLETLGAEFWVSVEIDYTVLNLEVLEENLDRALLELRFMVLEPQFEDKEANTVKRILSYELRDREKDPTFLGRRQLLRTLYSGHPYQVSGYGYDVLKNVTARDIAGFYSRFYRPNNAAFLITGGLDLAGAVRKASQYFGTWVRQPVDRPIPPAPKPNDRERVCFVNVPALQEAFVFVGNLAMPMTSPDYFPFLVLNQVLGGSIGSRLFMNLRESKQYAYDASSEAQFFHTSGVYWAQAVVVPERIYPAVQEIVREMRILASERAVTAEIEQAKSYLVGSYPRKFESPEGFASVLSQVVALGLGDAHWNQAPESLMLVNTEKVLETAQRYFPAPPVVIIVGNGAWGVEAIKDFNLVEIYDVNGNLTMTVRKGVER